MYMCIHKYKMNIACKHVGSCEEVRPRMHRLLAFSRGAPSDTAADDLGSSWIILLRFLLEPWHHDSTS